MTMQSVFFKENRGSVHVQTRWGGLCSRTMMQPMANHDGDEAFPKLITSLELSANYAKGFNAAADDAVKEREVHTNNKQTLDHNKGNNYTTHDLFTLLSDYEVGVREDAQNGQQTAQVHDRRQGHFEFGFGRPTVCAKKYPYAEACYRVYSTYGNQIVGRIVLPLNTTTGGDGAMPIYVNAKQYNGIMRRRRKLEQLMASKKKVLESRKPYMHLSRHLHAMRRPRGSGGRFLNAKDSENSKKESKTDPTNKEQEHNKHNNLLLIYNSTGSSQVSEVVLRSTTKSSGGERCFSPNSEVSSHHHMLSFDMNDHLHHHAPPSFETFPNTNGLGFNVMAASDGTCVMGNSFLAKSSLSPAFGDN